MQTIRIHFISYFFISRIYWLSTCDICWYSFCHICWYNICDIYDLITHYYWIISNTFYIPTILTNTCARILTIIFFAHMVLFTLTLKFIIIISFLILIICCTFKFPFTITWNMFYQCFCLSDCNLTRTHTT